MRKRYFLFAGLAAAAIIASLPVVKWRQIKQRTELVQCGNQMNVILYVACLEWPMGHDDRLPTNFISMSEELIMPGLLICPSDHSRHAATNWTAFTEAHSSYELVTSGLTKADTNQVFLRCPIHGYTGYADDRLLDAAGNLVRPNRL